MPEQVVQTRVLFRCPRDHNYAPRKRGDLPDVCSRCGEVMVLARYVALDDVLSYLRGSDSDDHELEHWRREIASEIEREFGGELYA